MRLVCLVGRRRGGWFGSGFGRFLVGFGGRVGLWRVLLFVAIVGGSGVVGVLLCLGIVLV